MSSNLHPDTDSEAIDNHDVVMCYKITPEFTGKTSHTAACNVIAIVITPQVHGIISMCGIYHHNFAQADVKVELTRLFV